MIQLNIKPKNIPQGYKKADEVAEILQIGSINIVEPDVKALIDVHLCTAQKQEQFETKVTLNPDGTETVENISTGVFKTVGVGTEVYHEQLEYINPDYAGWIKDEDLLAFVCSKLEVVLV